MNMIKHKYILILLSLIFSISISAQDLYKIDKVVIDAGHGGKDPGAVGKHSKEKNIALAVSLKVGKLINDNLKDVQTIYTRDKDVFVELYKRADIANKAKADLFISIHCNAVNGTSAKGTETWIMGVSRSSKNLAVAKKENAAILLEADYGKNYNNFDPNSTESYIMFELLQNSYRDQSMSLANSVQNQFTSRVHRVNRGVKEAGLLVLVYSAMPSILVELGFISNPAEEKFLMSEEGQDYMASAIYRAFRDYKLAIERGKEIDKIVIPIETADKEEPVVEEIKPEEKLVKTPKKIEKSSSTKETAYFSIQFTTSRKNKPLSNFKGINDVWSYEQNGSIKYVSGKYKDFNKARKTMNKIRKGEYKDAFIVSFINGERVARKEAEAKIKEIEGK